MSEPKLYVASRASLPDRPAMWRHLRDHAGWQIVSSWIDEAGEGETSDFGELWSRIESEIRRCDGLILYAEPEDFPLKGAHIEAGMALALGKPVAIVMPCGLPADRSRKPIGSWICHPLCSGFTDLHEAWKWVASQSEPTP